MGWKKYIYVLTWRVILLDGIRTQRGSSTQGRNIFLLVTVSNWWHWVCGAIFKVLLLIIVLQLCAEKGHARSLMETVEKLILTCCTHRSTKLQWPLWGAVFVSPSQRRMRQKRSAGERPVERSVFVILCFMYASYSSTREDLGHTAVISFFPSLKSGLWTEYSAVLFR